MHRQRNRISRIHSISYLTASHGISDETRLRNSGMKRNRIVAAAIRTAIGRRHKAHNGTIRAAVKYIIANNLHFVIVQLCEERTKITKSFETKRAPFVFRNSFVREPVSSAFSDTQTRIEFLFSYLSIFLRFTLSYYFIVIEILYRFQ
ncbi:hypothetical protein PUN28_017268 [Cardiocondyla obscurior]|uniref:Uncharacterized protein n=1 Tax=Cardiocondyla obscurior TaxID=286306 RepID=A0AAW2EMN4_9HYME